MFRQYLIDEIERYQDKESCEAFEQWCEEMEGLKKNLHLKQDLRLL